MRRTRDFAQIKGNGKIDLSIAEFSLKALKVDDNGLDEMDNRILSTIIENLKVDQRNYNFSNSSWRKWAEH